MLFLLGFALLLSLSVCGIKNIPCKHEEVKVTWAQVQNQYKQRCDLIPNLVNMVKGLAAQEKEMIIGVTEFRCSNVANMKLPDHVLTDPQVFQAFQKNQAALGLCRRLRPNKCSKALSP